MRCSVLPVPGGWESVPRVDVISDIDITFSFSLMKLLFLAQGYSCMLLALGIAGSRPAADLNEVVITLSKIVFLNYFFFLKIDNQNLLFV